MKDKFKKFSFWLYLVVAIMGIGFFGTKLLYEFNSSKVVVTGTSMSPTYHDGEAVNVSNTKDRGINRGDVIAFYAPKGAVNSKQKLTNSIKLPKELQNKGLSNIGFIKRVIGLPNDHISYKNGKLYINGKGFTENYIKTNSDEFKQIVKDKTIPYMDDFDITVPPNKYYVLGDNRPFSEDSRIFGSIAKESIIGKVLKQN